MIALAVMVGTMMYNVEVEANRSVAALLPETGNRDGKDPRTECKVRCQEEEDKCKDDEKNDREACSNTHKTCVENCKNRAKRSVAQLLPDENEDPRTECKVRCHDEENRCKDDEKNDRETCSNTHKSCVENCKNRAKRVAVTSCQKCKETKEQCRQQPKWECHKQIRKACRECWTQWRKTNEYRVCRKCMMNARETLKCKSKQSRGERKTCNDDAKKKCEDECGKWKNKKTKF